MMKTIVVLAVVLTLGLAASGRWLVLGKESAPEISAASRCKVARGDLGITIEENGYLTAKNNVNVKPKFKGQGTITWLVEEGKSVVPGDILVELDKTQLETQVTDLENQLAQYQIERDAAQANLEIQERDNDASIEKAGLTLQMAQLTLERYEKGDAPNELRKLKLAAEKADSELERAKERYEQVPELVKQGFLTRIQEEEERIRVREAEIGQENAAKDLELYQTYNQRMELTKRQTDVKDGERELENARKKADINLKERQANLAQRERQLTSTQTRLDQQKTELGYYTIKAERPGIVHYGDPENPWYRENIKVGNTVNQGMVLVTIPDLTEMQVLVQVHEADIDMIKKDMPVIVTVETRKGESFTAKITDIASVASSANWTDESNKSFRVEVMLDATTAELRSGVTARAEIQVETLSGVLYVPIHAIVPEGGKHLAFVVHGAEIEQRDVKIGKNNAHHVQVLEGLDENDEILLYDPRSEGRGNASGEKKDAGQTLESPLTGAPAAGGA